MSTAQGIVADAAADVIAARISTELPGLPDSQARGIARKVVEDLKADGWRIAGPVIAVAASRRRKGASG